MILIKESKIIFCINLYQEVKLYMKYIIKQNININIIDKYIKNK